MKDDNSLISHLQQVADGKRRFENVFQAVTRMISEYPVEETSVNGETKLDFQFFRQGKKHIVGWYDEANSFVSFVKDAAEGGSSKEMAFVLVGEPGNGKTFFVEYICDKYREFLNREENRKFTFCFRNLDRIGDYGKITFAESQTFEDPMILAMNLFKQEAQNRAFLKANGFSKKQINQAYQDYRPLGACSQYILRSIRKHVGDEIDNMLEYIEIIPVEIDDTSGTVTGKYAAKDKITSSAVDLLGDESLQRLLHIIDSNNPFRFDLRRGALARVGGGGIHFSDEIYKNKKDLVQVYLGVIQNRTIELDGFKWPLDTLIIATSNNAEFDTFISEKEEAPIVDRCRICYVAHNTDFKLQKQLTNYAIGGKKKTSTTGDGIIHEDPNLNYAASVAVVLTRLPHSKKLTPVETMKLAAGDVAGDKSVKTLIEVIDTLASDSNITKRWGQKGLGHRNLGRALQILIESFKTNKGKCMFAYDIFKAFERVVYDYVAKEDRSKFLDDLKVARTLYRKEIMAAMFNAYMDEPLAIKFDVFSYINMIIGIDAENLGPDRMWKYKDPQTGEIKAIKIDEKYINSVEERLGLKTKEQRASFRNNIRKIYGEKMSINPNYDFMDNVRLVKAVTEVRLNSEIAGSSSLIGALTNRTNEENQKLYDRMVNTMIRSKEENGLGYCKTCAQKTIEYFCQKKDE